MHTAQFTGRFGPRRATLRVRYGRPKAKCVRKACRPIYPAPILDLPAADCAPRLTLPTRCRHLPTGGTNLWNWGADRRSPLSTPGASREGSLHGGGMWAWGAGRENPAPSCPSTPAASREASLHGGNAFGGEAAKPGAKAGMWDWQKGRPSPESSGHAGNAFGALFGGGGGGGGGGDMWNWGQKSNPGSRNSSTHGGTNFAPSNARAIEK